MSKLYRARSLLYRRQILQENIRWKALDEICKIYMLLHRSDLNMSDIFRQNVSHFLAIFCLKIAKHFAIFFFCIFLAKFCKKMRKSLTKFFLKYWGLSGAKACKSCRSRQELSNEYFLAKLGVDTEENEPYKVCSFGWKIRERFDIEPFN